MLAADHPPYHCLGIGRGKGGGGGKEVRLCTLRISKFCLASLPATPIRSGVQPNVACTGFFFFSIALLR